MMFHINGLPYQVLKEFSTHSDIGEPTAWIATDMDGCPQLILSSVGNKFVASRAELVAAYEKHKKAADDLGAALEMLDNPPTKPTNYARIE